MPADSPPLRGTAGPAWLADDLRAAHEEPGRLDGPEPLSADLPADPGRR